MAENEVSEVQVCPTKSGKWTVEADGKKVGTFEDRKSAIAEARAAAGGTSEELFDANGKLAGTVETPGARVVLMRPDGSEYGELQAPPGNPDGAQRLSITPATQEGEAV